MRIVQLSDIHLSANNISDFRSYYLEALKKDLIKFDVEKKINLILITGDLVDKGGESFNSTNPYLIFEKEFIKPLQKLLNLTNNEFLIIPGNHDIERDQIDRLSEIGLLSEINSIDKANHYLDKTVNQFNSINNRIRRFKEFEENFHKKSSDYSFSNNESVYIYSENGLQVGFLLVNDSWRCSSNLEPKNHFIGINQLLNGKEWMEAFDTHVNIVLFHHPLDAFNLIEQREIKDIVQKFNFELVLAGHTHKSDIENRFGVNGNAIFINAKSAFNNPREKVSEFQPGFNIIDINLESLHISCFYRKYIPRRFEFDKDTTAAIDGLYSDRLIPKGEKRNFYELYDLANKTVHNHLEDFNNALLTFKTNTIAPKDVEQLFVLPKLTDKPSNIEIKNDKKEYTIDDIILDEKNIVIFGNKESGKSTLLNRINIETSNYFSKYRKIPVSINFKKLKSDDVISSTRKYLNENALKIKEFATKGDLLLLVDNYDEGEKYEYAKKHIANFIENYPASKLILTTSENFDELVEKKSILFTKFLFKSIFIGSVGIKEFKELANRWFTKKDEEWHHEHIEKLIKFFQILKIPRTFFSVSLYLWIIEKQEGFKPINKNFLLNKFLQYILEGLVTEEGKAGSYNYDRKKETLAEVAFEMFAKGNELEGYSLLKEEILQAISNYFKKNQRSFDAAEAFQIFLDKGIFKLTIYEDVEKVDFRFESFFQFFLSFNIDTNKEFKEHVFSKSQIFSFIDELDYYSARHENDKELLQHVIALVEENFKVLDAFIGDNTDKYMPTKLIFLGDTDSKKVETEIEKSQANDAQMDKIFKEQIGKLPVNDSINIKEKYENKTPFYQSLELAARVLKNAENIQDPNLINNSIDIILQKVVKYSIYFQSLLTELFKKAKVEKKNENEEYIQSIEFIEKLLWYSPLIHQQALLTWIGSDFLQLPLQRKINSYLTINREKHNNHYEQLLSIFLYIDLKLPNYVIFLKQTIRHIDNKYFEEIYLAKLFDICSTTSERSAILPQLKEQMTLLLSKAKGLSKEDAIRSIDENIKSQKETFKTIN